MEQSDTLDILKRLERGEITSAQADERLNESPRVERMDEPPIDFERAPRWMRRLWMYFLVSGLIGVGMGAWIIVATRANVLWFLCGLPILLLGALMTALAASADSMHWLYVNVDETGRKNKRVRVAVPFPFGLVRLAFGIAKLFGQHPKAQMKFSSKTRTIPLDWADMDEFVDSIERELREHRAVTVDVDDKGSRVQVYIV